MKNNFELIGIKDQKLYMLNNIFIHNSEFRGANGTVFEFITEKDINKRNNFEKLKDYFREEWKNSVINNKIDCSLYSFMSYKDIKSFLKDNQLEFIEQDITNVSRAKIEIQLLEDEKLNLLPAYVTLNCIEIGRVFKKNMIFDIVFNQKLLDIISEYEK